jgi:hypothetical protein
MIQRGYIKFTMGERNNKERKNNTVKNDHLNDSAECLDFEDREKQKRMKFRGT